MCENIWETNLTPKEKTGLSSSEKVDAHGLWFSYSWKWMPRMVSNRGNPSFRTRDYHVQITVSIY